MLCDLWYTKGRVGQMSACASWASTKSELHIVQPLTREVEDVIMKTIAAWDDTIKGLNVRNTASGNSVNVLIAAVVLSKAEAFQCQIQKAYAGYKGSQYVNKSRLSCPHYKAVSASTLLAETGNILIVRTWKPLTESADLCDFEKKSICCC